MERADININMTYMNTLTLHQLHAFLRTNKDSMMEPAINRIRHKMRTYVDELAAFTVSGTHTGARNFRKKNLFCTTEFGSCALCIFSST